MAEPAGPGARKRWLLYAGAVAGAWATVPRFWGPELAGLDSTTEVVDHLVPGIVVLAGSAAMFVVARDRARPVGVPMFVAGLIVTLAGLWMTATHIPLLAQARRHEVTWGAAWFHTMPGLVVLALGIVWAAAHWADAAPPDDRPETLSQRANSAASSGAHPLEDGEFEDPGTARSGPVG